jgi:FkbM family methyltransferase
MSDVVNVRGYRIHCPNGGRVGSKLALGEPYEAGLLDDIRLHHHQGTAFDIGAHIGNHTLFLAAECGLKVHAWEPHDQSREALEANVALNPGLDVTVHPWAAGAQDDRGRLTSGMWVEFDPNRDGATMTLGRGHVQVHRIDDHLDIHDLSVVKVDVEGMEADALAGMAGHLERCRPSVYAETHRRTDHDRIAAVLEPLGYAVTRTSFRRQASPMERWDHPKGPR